jgi:hypothetical protein
VITSEGRNLDAASRLAEIYAEKVQQLETSLNHPAVREEATTVLRVLIDRIELLPRGDIKGVDAVLHGDLAEILAFCGESGGVGKPGFRGVHSRWLRGLDLFKTVPGGHCEDPSKVGCWDPQPPIPNKLSL